MSPASHLVPEDKVVEFHVERVSNGRVMYRDVFADYWDAVRHHHNFGEEDSQVVIVTYYP